MRQLVELGKVIRPHGFRGAFVVSSPAGQDCALAHLKSVWIGRNTAGALAYPLVSASWMPKGWKVELEGVTSDREVEALRGAFVYAERSQLPDLPTGEYYLSDLQGAEVVESGTGRELGRWVGAESLPGQDRWWIEREGVRFCIPAVSHFIEKVDPIAKRITVRNLSELE